jgi:hypothetical protein
MTGLVLVFLLPSPHKTVNKAANSASNPIDALHEVYDKQVISQ